MWVLLDGFEQAGQLVRGQVLCLEIVDARHLYLEGEGSAQSLVHAEVDEPSQQFEDVPHGGRFLGFCKGDPYPINIERGQVPRLFRREVRFEVIQIAILISADSLETWTSSFVF